MSNCRILILLCCLAALMASGVIGQENELISVDQASKAVAYLEGEKPKLESVDGITYEIGLRSPGSNQFRLLTERITGTGFFVKGPKKLFLVTAGHVARGLISNIHLIISDSRGNSKLYSLDGKLNWFFSPVADVAATQISDEPLATEFKINAIDVSFLAKTEDYPASELPLVAIGFPLGLGVRNKFSPLRRETHAASGLIDLPRADNNQPATFFVLQDPSIGGYSGAPVFSTASYRFGNTLMPGLDLDACIGIIHGTISDKMGGGLGLVTPASYVYQLIRQQGE
jgi:S1-C subfamily serine protease